MSFDSYGAGKSGEKKEIDFNALNIHTVETAQLQTKETLCGYVSAIVDLGTQKQEDAKLEFKGSKKEQSKLIEEKPDTYFVEEDGKTYKCFPSKPVQCVVIAVDFPDIIIDKGQFFGESKPLPLRLWLGGQFYLQDGMVVGRPTPLRLNKVLGDWSFSKTHLFHKMAVAAKLIDSDECFLPAQLDQPFGKTFPC